MHSSDVRAQLDRILASPTFADAERARKFLRFVVEAAIAGRAAEIKESVIAVEALGRATSFDSRADPIVRVEAGRLRTKLLSYYHAEGACDLVLIDLPKGGYVPQFRQRQESLPRAEANQGARPPSRMGLWAALALSAAGFGIGWRYWPRQASPSRETLRVSILPPDGAALRNSALSPDGRYLAFTARSGRVTRVWIRALNASGVP